MTILKLAHNGLWAEADLDAEPRAWARALVLNRFQQEGLPPDETRAEALAGVIASVTRVLAGQEPRPQVVLLLYPKADEFVVTTVSLRYEELDHPFSLDEVAEQLLPAEMLDRPASQEVLQTPSGPALRLVQRHHSPVSPGVEHLQEHVTYVWVFDDEDDGTVLAMLSTTFEDMVEAGDWRDSLDELARGLTVELESGAVAGSHL